MWEPKASAVWLLSVIWHCRFRSLILTLLKTAITPTIRMKRRYLFILQSVYKGLRNLTSESQLLYQSNDGWWILCSLDQNDPWNTLHPNSLFLSTHLTPWHNLLLSKLYSSTHFASQHFLLLSILYSQEHFAPWNTFLPGILYFLEHFLLL